MFLLRFEEVSHDLLGDCCVLGLKDKRSFRPTEFLMTVEHRDKTGGQYCCDDPGVEYIHIP